MSKAAKETLETVEKLARVLHRNLARAAHPDPLDLLTGARELRRAVATLDRESIKQCNGIQRYDAKAGRVLASWTESDQTKSDSAKEKARGAAIEALQLVFGPDLMGFDVEFQTDPRGPMVKIWPARGRDKGAPLASF